MDAESAYLEAERAVRVAESLIGQSRWEEASEQLLGQLALCQTWSAEDCRLLVYYGLGYLYQSWADRAPEDRDAYLERAASYYEELLSERTGQAEALVNLALVKRSQGSGAFGEAFASQVAAAPPQIAGQVLLLQGDAALADDDQQQAVSLYRRARALNPDADDALYRIAEAYRSETTSAIAPLLAFAEGWELMNPGPAVYAYEVAIESATSDPDATAEAVLRWTRLRADDGTLTRARVAELPGREEIPALGELVDFFEEECSESTAPWWIGATMSAQVLVAAALSDGNARIRRGETATVERCWERVRQFAPEETNSDLEVLTALALLYSREPSLDATGSKLDDLIVDLFLGKGGAIRRADLETRQRYNSALGSIYAERGIWDARSGPEGADGAIYQLTSALTVAHERDELSGGYQPLPYMRELLADGHAATDRAGASGQYLAAARAYLDTDQFTDASRSLDRAYGFPLSEREESEAEALQSLLQVRSRVRRSDSDGTMFECGGTGFYEAFELVQGALVEPTFLGRQLYKMHSDCVLLTEDRMSALHATRAVRLAAQPGIELTGAADAIRLERSIARLQPYVEELDAVGVPSGLAWVPEVYVEVETHRPRYVPTYRLDADTRSTSHIIELAWAEDTGSELPLSFESIYGAPTAWQGRLEMLQLDMSHLGATGRMLIS